jgi:hypothetical protein
MGAEHVMGAEQYLSALEALIPNRYDLHASKIGHILRDRYMSRAVSVCSDGIQIA